MPGTMPPGYTPNANRAPSQIPHGQTPLTGSAVHSDLGSGYYATCYSPPFGRGSINGGGITAGGTDLRTGGPHYVIAAGAGSGLKLGDRVKITPNPYGNNDLTFLVDDHGGAIIGKHIDIFVPSHDQALTWGRKAVHVAKVGTPVGEPDGPVVPNPLKPIEEAVTKFMGLVSVLFSGAFWLRVLLIVAGGGLLAFGLFQIGKEYAPSAMLGSSVKGMLKNAE